MRMVFVNDQKIEADSPDRGKCWREREKVDRDPRFRPTPQSRASI
jgi:hypothetical protein